MALVIAAVFVALAAQTQHPRDVAAQSPDTTPPTFVSAEIGANGESFTVTFSEDIMLSPFVQLVSEYTKFAHHYFIRAVLDVTIDGRRDVLDRSRAFISGRTLQLQVTTPPLVATGQVVRVSYDNVFARHADGVFQDAAGNKVPYFTSQVVQNRSTVASADPVPAGPVYDVATLALDEGQTATYTVKLPSQPTQTETVYLYVEPLNVGQVNPTQMTFTIDNWDDPQTATLTLNDDADSIDAWAILTGHIGAPPANPPRKTTYIQLVVTDQDEPVVPIGETTLTYAENGTTNVTTYSRPNSGTIRWAVYGPDKARFSINRFGQGDNYEGYLRFVSPPDFEKPADSNGDNVYVVYIAAQSYSSSGLLPVTVRVTGVDEPPRFASASTTRAVPENSGPGVSVGEPVEASDDAGDTPTYTLEGTDAASFEIDSATGQIQTTSGVTYDHEIKSRYAVTVKADDGNGQTDTIMVTVNIEDLNEAPAFAESSTTREVAENLSAGSKVGAPVAASDDDRDNLTYLLSGADAGAFEIVAGSGQLRTKAPLNHEDRDTYSVTVTVHDSKGADGLPDTTIDDTVFVTISVTDVNEVPAFPSTETGRRSVAENTEAGIDIGAPVEADDPDDDSLIYTLSGADDIFEIDSSSGQLRTKGVLDHERRGSHRVNVTATDPSRTSDTIGVTITVTNVDEEGTVRLSSEPQVDSLLKATLTDPDGRISGLTWTWEWSTDLSTWTAIAGVATSSYTPAAGDENRYLRATANYTDGEGPNKRARSSPTDQVQVAPVTNDPPRFPTSETGQRSVAENTPRGVDIGAQVVADDSNNDSLTYAFLGAGADYFDLDAKSGQLRTKADLDYERRQRYDVRITARDPSGETDDIRITIMVENVDEAGTVGLSAQPQVRTSLTATLTDPDGSVAGVTWTWERSSDQLVWTAIDGATSGTYTPAESDENLYLRATAAYADGEGAGKSAQLASVDPVQPYRPPAPKPQAPPSSRSSPPSSSRSRGASGPSAPSGTSTPSAPATSPNVIGGTASAVAVEQPGNRLMIQRHDVPDASFTLAIGSISADGMTIVMAGVIRDATLGQTYIVVRRASDGRIVRRWVPPDSSLVYQIPWPIVNSQYTVPVGVIGAIPLDDQFPEPNLLVRRFDGGDDRIFAYDASLRQWRHVPGIATFQALGFYWCNVTVADAGFFDRLNPGPPYPASDTPARDDYPNCLTS